MDDDRTLNQVGQVRSGPTYGVSPAASLVRLREAGGSGSLGARPRAVLTSAFFFYARARAPGLADPGRKADLVERSLRLGEADPELADTLRHEAQGKSL